MAIGSSGKGRTAAFSILCALLAQQPAVFAASAVHAAPLTEHQRLEHALDRFTFGPAPGEEAAVEKMGLRRWFQEQLHPESIDDSALNQRLAEFPAMQLSQAELFERYPSRQMLQQVVAQKLPMPSDPLEHAIYADNIAFYVAAKAKKEAADARTAAFASSTSGIPAKKTATPPMPGGGLASAAPAQPAYQNALFSQAAATQILQLTPDARMAHILAMPPAEFMAFDRSLDRPEMAALGNGLSPAQRETIASLSGAERVVREEIVGTRMLRDVYSQRQLQAVMTDFWLNHFNVFLNKNGKEPYLLPAYERDVIRPRALGKFEDLLVAVAQSPAMLMYLDNWQSTGPDSVAATRAAQRPTSNPKRKDLGLNENYGRELMELHTLGAQCEVSADHPAKNLPKPCGVGYTQADVTTVAKLLTGWTIERPDRGGDFRFDDRRHEPGPETVLGKTIADGGENQGLQLLHMLATSLATAHFISQKLAVRFVSDTPPPALVNRMTKAWMHSDGDMKVVLQAMFDSPEFWFPSAYRAKVKTPEEFVISAVRASGADVSNPVPLTQALARLGMPFYGMQTPNGYDWKAEPWVNTGDLIDRMNLALMISRNHMPGVQTDWNKLLNTPDKAESSSNAATKECALEQVLLGEDESDTTRSVVLAQSSTLPGNNAFPLQIKKPKAMAVVLSMSSAAKPAPANDPQTAAMAGLLLGSPEFQRR